MLCTNMIIRSLKMFLLFVFMEILCIQYALAYRKYYIEDECISANKFQKIFYRLPASGPDSVGELRPNRFGTYSRMGRNCLIKLVPPEGYGVIVTVLKVDFMNHEGCKDYIKIFENDEESERLCGYQEVGLDGKTFFSDKELEILYHTSERGMGFSTGFKLIFTVAKLNSGSCASSDEFKCENSRCIWGGVTCDGINNCGDASDENSSDNPHCPDITPIAIVAVVLGVACFITVLVIMCLCCCRSNKDKVAKSPLLDDFPLRPNAGYSLLPGYSPLPGYSYGTMNNIAHLQPVHSPTEETPAPVFYPPSCPPNPGLPYAQQKVNKIIYDRPPPYMA